MLHHYSSRKENADKKMRTRNPNVDASLYIGVHDKQTHGFHRFEPKNYFCSVVNNHKTKKHYVTSRFHTSRFKN